MKTYFRILKFVKPYWKHLTASVFCTILFALLSGASVYLSIPLLETLFQESSGDILQTIPAVQDSGGSAFDWFTDGVESILDEVKEFIFEGDKSDILIRICFQK